VTVDLLTRLIFWAGVAQLSILIASAMVPYRLQWRTALSSLSPLHRQMYWVYGGYVVLSIVAFALLSIANARELASGSGLGRGVCGYVAIFWGIRVILQSVFDVKEHLTEWWLTAGYHLLTLLFVALTIIYAWAAIGGVAR
jgi:hypothetical protein